MGETTSAVHYFILKRSAQMQTQIMRCHAWPIHLWTWKLHHADRAMSQQGLNDMLGKLNMCNMYNWTWQDP